MAKCKALTKNCRKCGSRIEGARVEKCPQCGEDMHCGQSAVDGYSLCVTHGGPVPSRNFYGRGGRMTTGSGSQFPLTRLASTYRKMRSDGRVLSNRAAVEIIDERVLQLAERIDVDDAPDRINSLYIAWTEYQQAKAQGKTVEMLQKEQLLDHLFEKARTDYEAWNQMMVALDLRRKMVESEVKVLKEIKAIMTVEDGYHLLAKMESVLMKLIDDPKKLKQVQYEFTRLIGESGDRAGETTGGDDWTDGGEEGGAEGSGEVDQEGISDPGDEERPETTGQA